MEKMEGKWNEKTYDGGWEMSHHLEGDVLQDECVGPFKSFPNHSR